MVSRILISLSVLMADCAVFRAYAQQQQMMPWREHIWRVQCWSATARRSGQDTCREWCSQTEQRKLQPSSFLTRCYCLSPCSCAEWAALYNLSPPARLRHPGEASSICAGIKNTSMGARGQEDDESWAVEEGHQPVLNGLCQVHAHSPHCTLYADKLRTSAWDSIVPGQKK